MKLTNGIGIKKTAEEVKTLELLFDSYEED